MSDSIIKNAEQIFKALDSLEKITARPDKGVEKVGFNDLYRYANDPHHQVSEKLQHLLSTDLQTRRDLKRLLHKRSIVQMPRAAAASSGDIEQREADGFCLKLKPSKASPEQVYLIIEAIDRDESPSLLFIDVEDGPLLRLNIDDFQDGEAQILLSSQDDIVKALRNPKSEVILR